MKWLSNASIDALGNSLMRKYMSGKANNLLSVDIEGFVRDYLKLPVVYHRFAENDATKLGFISDGRTPLNIFFGNKIIQKVFPKGTIVIEEYLMKKSETGRRRFTIAHEAAHYIMDRSLATASFHREFDGEKTYSPDELKATFNIAETNVDRLAAALLMPEYLIRNYLTQSKREYGIFIYDDGFIRPEDNCFLQMMAADIGTSVTALLIRIKELGLYVRKSMNEYIAELGIRGEPI